MPLADNQNNENTPNTIYPQQINTNGWNEHAKLVLHELERLNTNYESLAKCVRELDNRLGVIEWKSGGIAAITGAVVSIILKIVIPS